MISSFSIDQFDPLTRLRFKEEFEWFHLPCQAPPIITKRIIPIFRRVKAVFILVDSFIPKQRITVKSFWMRFYSKLFWAHLIAKVLYQTKRNPRMGLAVEPEKQFSNFVFYILLIIEMIYILQYSSYIHASSFYECFTHFAVHHAVNIIAVTFCHAAHAWMKVVRWVSCCLLMSLDPLVRLTDAIW